MGDRITADEEALLRSWLAGHDLKNIAAARKTTATELYESLIDVCGYDRLTARKVLRDGVRRPARRKPADLDPAGDAEGARVQRVVNDVLLDHSPAVAHVLDAARALSAAVALELYPGCPMEVQIRDLDLAVATLDGTQPAPHLGREAIRPTPHAEPLETWSAHRCAHCRYLGPAGDHRATVDRLVCDGHATQLQPVALLVMPREV